MLDTSARFPLSFLNLASSVFFLAASKTLGLTARTPAAGLASVVGASTTGVSNVGASTVGNSNATQFAVPYGQIEYMISNSTNANIILWLYDIIPRKMIYATDTNYKTPMDAWVNGMRVQLGTGGGSNLDLVPGARPFESKLFCENYKVKKVSKIILSPGVLHRHIVTSTQRRWYTDSQFNNLFTAGVPSSQALWFGGRTILTMAIIMGTPGHSRATHASADVTTAPAGIDVVSIKRYQYFWSATAAKQVFFNDTLPVAAADLEAVPEAQGAFNTIVTA